jgi:tetratricopeptide (TPR) repeat protein
MLSKKDSGTKEKMKLKRVFLLGAIAAIGIVNILMYWNVHLCYRATENTEDPEKKIKILKSANLFYSSNDSVFYEMGKSYFDLGMENLDDKTSSQTYLQKSIQHFNRSLKINPASYFGHFNLAQSLLYMSYVSSDFEDNPYEEYKKAALLAGHNSQVYFEVGKIFLSLWPKLTEEDRDFTRETLKKILESKDPQKVQAIMHIWEMNVSDYRVMEEMLPEDASIYRMYAQFLGEKSLSSEERQGYLAQAEWLEFERAKDEYISGEGEFQYYRLKEASRSFLSSLRRLERINFYQNLVDQEWINVEEFLELKKSVYLNLAKCTLEEGKDFKQAEGYLRSYLAVEEEVAAVGELESFLKLRGHIKERFGERLDDLGNLFFQTLLYFKLNRYRDIMKLGRLLEQSFVVVTEGKKDEYLKVLQLVGDSCQKVDYIYDAGEFYRKALEIDPDNLEILLRIRQNYERLNEEEKIQEIDARMESLLSPRKIELKETGIKKGQRFTQRMTLDGSEIIMDLSINWGKEISLSPLIAVLFNGRVVWEGYLRLDEGKGQDADAVLSLPVKSKTGENNLAVIPLNRSVELIRIAYRRVNS